MITRIAPAGAKKIVYGVLVIGLLLGLAASPAWARPINPNDIEGVQMALPHANSEKSIFDANSILAGERILLACSDDNNCEPIRIQLVSLGGLGAVDVYNARYGTPSLGQLLNYDVVVTWSNYAYHNPVAMGDVLANYVDNGGKVINLMWSMGTHAYRMQGRFMNSSYTAMNGTNVLRNEN